MSSTRKSINTSYNISTVLSLLSNLQWRSIRRMGPSPSWDTIVKPEADGTLSITVYRKPTHSDQYLQWDSHHQLSAQLWTRLREGIVGLLGRLLIRLTTRVPQVPSLLSMKLKPRVTLSYPTHKVSVKESRRSVGGMAYRPTSKALILSGTYWSPPRTKTLWSAKVGPYIGFNVGTSLVMMNTYGKTPGPLVKDTKST